MRKENRNVERAGRKVGEKRSRRREEGEMKKNNAV